MASTAYAYSRPPAGTQGFTAILAWQQQETWIFLVLQVVSMLFAYAISARDEMDRVKARGEQKDC